MKQKEFRVGVGVMIFKENKILLGKRKGSHGSGEFSFPGGKMEYLESFKDCVLREVKEECGVEIDNLEFLIVANIKQYLPKHHILIGFKATWKSGEPSLLEPEKSESWNWYDLNKLPEPLFEPSKIMIEAYKNKKSFLDN